MQRKTEQEIDAMVSVIKDNPDMTAVELAAHINKNCHIASGEIKFGYINYLRSKKMGGKPSRARRPAQEKEPKEQEEEVTFDGFLLKLEEVGRYAKSLRDKQKEKIAAFLE